MLQAFVEPHATLVVAEAALTNPSNKKWTERGGDAPVHLYGFVALFSLAVRVSTIQSQTTGAGETLVRRPHGKSTMVQ